MPFVLQTRPCSSPCMVSQDFYVSDTGNSRKPSTCHFVFAEKKLKVWNDKGQTARGFWWLSIPSTCWTRHRCRPSWSRSRDHGQSTPKWRRRTLQFVHAEMIAPIPASCGAYPRSERPRGWNCLQWFWISWYTKECILNSALLYTTRTSQTKNIQIISRLQMRVRRNDGIDMFDLLSAFLYTFHFAWPSSWSANPRTPIPKAYSNALHWTVSPSVTWVIMAKISAWSLQIWGIMFIPWLNSTYYTLIAFIVPIFSAAVACAIP